MKKEPTIKDLKAMAFDLNMQAQQIQKKYSTVLQQIVKKQQEKEIKK